MAITVLGAKRRVHRTGLGNALPEERFEELMREEGHTWRQRVLTPVVFLRLFVLQMLNGNIAINALRHLSGIKFTAAAYVKARQRMPLRCLCQVLREIALGGMSSEPKQDEDEKAGRVFVVDGSSASTPDTPTLRKRFGLPSNQAKGVGYPQAKLLGLMDLATGLIIRMVVRSVFTHDLRGVLRVHAALRAKDILLGDRAFGSVAHLLLLAERGVYSVFRISQRRNCPDGKVRWRKRGRKSPPWIDPDLYRKLRTFVNVRVISYRIEHAGYRTRSVRLVTTLPEEQWSDEQVCALYARRWEIETAFGHAKTSLKMGTPKCKTAQGVMKELAVYLIVYNLIRLQMLKWARLAGVDVRRVSFIDAARFLAARAAGLTGVDDPILNPHRPGRRQLRVLRRRPKHYPFLTKPREETDINHDPRER